MPPFVTPCSGLLGLGHRGIAPPPTHVEPPLGSGLADTMGRADPSLGVRPRAALHRTAVNPSAPCNGE